MLAYLAEDTQDSVDWEAAFTADTTGTDDGLHNELTAVSEVIKQTTNDDGTYEIYLIPEKYQILIDKARIC